MTLETGWRADMHSQPAVGDLPSLLEIIDDLLHVRGDGNGKADSVGDLLREDDGGVDADHIAVNVEQRPAAVSGIDLSGGLNEIRIKSVFLAGELWKRAAGSADNADADAHVAAGGKAVGVADRDSPLPAMCRGVGITNRGKVLCRNFQDRDVGARIGADNNRGVNLVIVGGDPELFAG